VFSASPVPAAAFPLPLRGLAALPRIANPGYGPRGYQTPPRQAPALAVAARA
jgi:hypothetical protein